MRYPLPLRLLVAVLLSLGTAALLLLLLYATSLGFEVWERLRASPPWFAAAYGAGLVLLIMAGTWAVWRVLTYRARPPATAAPEAPAPPRSVEELQARIAAAEAAGVDVEAARAEIRDLFARRGAGELHVVLFGRVSTGKSALVRALLPGAEAPSDPRAGTTRAARRHVWTSPAGDRLVVTDLPGLEDPSGDLSPLAREEAQRAHVVVYLVDGDLTRDQHRELQELLALQKPVILALNKADLYTDAELAPIRRRLAERVLGAERVDVVAVSAGGGREVIRIAPDGSERTERRAVPPRVDALAATLQRRIDEDPRALESLRDASVFVLASRKLDQAVRAHRRERADALVGEYARKAVVGALAAVTPGSDLVIQGFLGVQLVQRLCEVYEVPARKVDVGRFLELAARRVGKTLPLFLAVAGNGLKAFPGLGTLTGGLLHAVAYGMIFDSLGRAVTETLEARGALPEGPALRRFEESLSDDLEARARRFARLALEETGAGRGGEPRR